MIKYIAKVTPASYVFERKLYEHKKTPRGYTVYCGSSVSAHLELADLNTILVDQKVEHRYKYWSLEENESDFRAKVIEELQKQISTLQEMIETVDCKVTVNCLKEAVKRYEHRDLFFPQLYCYDYCLKLPEFKGKTRDVIASLKFTDLELYAIGFLEVVNRAGLLPEDEKMQSCVLKVANGCFERLKG